MNGNICDIGNPSKCAFLLTNIESQCGGLEVHSYTDVFFPRFLHNKPAAPRIFGSKIYGNDLILYIIDRLWKAG